MGRKTVAQLEEENLALKKENVALKEDSEQTPTTEVTELKETVEVLKRTVEEQKAAEAKLLKDIENMGDVEMVIQGGQVVGTGIRVFTPDEYAAHSKANGRVMGRLEGTKTECSIEELRALINSNWTPSMVMDKHGIDAGELQQLVWKLSLKELRDKPIVYDIKRDFFRKDG